MMRSSFVVASALASGVLVYPANARINDIAESNNVFYASTHKFQIPKKAMDGIGKSGKAPWMEFRNRECIGLGMFFSILGNVAVRLQCEGGGESQFCHGDLFDPECDDYLGPPKFYLCKNGECVEQMAPAKP
ncbi:MAG TPA: hypothetical protein VFS88_09840 [Micavibrio sp.]|nr:hypothetical protein [Micavibrio sp.]